jgi:hypothetical protein
MGNRQDRESKSAPESLPVDPEATRRMFVGEKLGAVRTPPVASRPGGPRSPRPNPAPESCPVDPKGSLRRPTGEEVGGGEKSAAPTDPDATVRLTR